jgi:hypothetical protein
VFALVYQQCQSSALGSADAGETIPNDAVVSTTAAATRPNFRILLPSIEANNSA